MSPGHPELPGKTSLLHWFDDFAVVRNKTRGHGAKRAGELGALCGSIQESVDLIVANLSVFKREWAYLFRNMSKKYRVTPWTESVESLDHLKSRTDVAMRDGVYIVLSEPRLVELIYSDRDASDFFYPNGSFTSKSFEVLSYVTGSIDRRDSSPYIHTPEGLPPSHTEGQTKLETIGEMLANLPPLPATYVRRMELEEELKKQLLLDHHPIVTLSGRGGIGKTSLALHVVHDIALGYCPFSVCIWFSSRDIDLLQEGTKRVRPQGISVMDFARIYSSLVGSTEAKAKGFDHIGFLSEALSEPGSLGRVLFVFDN
ncbi:hypothetical protein JW848_10195, partial [Candidatus Bipolaricaulota bacterium]|nr:hypothetical protein [Candidatus Bipolaricaulota bacterium]